jgi:hypothetical protein
MSGPFKMKGSSGLGYGNQHSEGKGVPMIGEIVKAAGGMMGKASPAPYATPAKKDEKEEKVVETRGKDGSITKSKGGKSSIYPITSKTKNKDGSYTIVRTNDQGNNDTRTQKPVSKT